MADLLSQVALLADRYLRGLDGRPVAPSRQALDNLAALDEPLAEGPTAQEAVIDRIQREGTCWCGGTTWQGRTAMRISVASWATTAEDVERSLEAIVRAWREE